MQPSPHDTFNTRISALRQWLHTQPSVEAWEAVCAILDTWPDDDDDELPTALEYTAQALDKWPSSLRVAPRRWTQRLLQGDPPSTLKLAAFSLLSIEDLATSSTFALTQPHEITQRFDHEATLFHTLKSTFTPSQLSLARHLSISGIEEPAPPDAHTLRWACRLVRWGQHTTLSVGLICAYIALSSWNTSRLRAWSPVRWVLRSLPFFPPMETQRAATIRALDAAQDWLHDPKESRAHHALTCIHEAMNTHTRGTAHNASKIILKSASLCTDPKDLHEAFRIDPKLWRCGQHRAAPEHGTPAAALWDALHGALELRDDTTHIIRRFLTLQLLDVRHIAPHLKLGLVANDHPHLIQHDPLRLRAHGALAPEPLLSA